MTALLFWSIILAALLIAAVELRALIVADERPVRPEWTLPHACDLCAGRLVNAAVYVPGGRALCLDCAEIVQASRTPSTEAA